MRCCAAATCFMCFAIPYISRLLVAAQLWPVEPRPAYHFRRAGISGRRMECGRMQMLEKSWLIAFLVVGLSAPALALDGTDTPASIKPALPLYKNSLHALNEAIEGLRAGDAASS